MLVYVSAQMKKVTLPRWYLLNHTRNYTGTYGTRESDDKLAQTSLVGLYIDTSSHYYQYKIILSPSHPPSYVKDLHKSPPNEWAFPAH